MLEMASPSTTLNHAGSKILAQPIGFHKSISLNNLILNAIHSISGESNMRFLAINSLSQSIVKSL